MSKENRQPNENSEEPTEPELLEGELEEERPKVVKKRKRKAKIISHAEEILETDEDKLLYEITSLLKKARAAIGVNNYIEAIKCYQDASVAANMIGDLEREKIYLTRANEILQEHPELREKGIELMKRRKMKAKIRKEEKFSLGQLISNLFVSLLILVSVYSGFFSALILQEIFEMGGSYNVAQLWGMCIAIEIMGLILAYFLGKRLLRFPE